MPPIEERDVWETVVLWPFTGYGRDGQVTVGDPVEVEMAVRFSAGNLSERRDPNGNTVQISGTAVVLDDVAIGSRMWYGRLADWLGTGSTDDVDDQVHEVIGFDSEPDLKARFTRRTVTLARFRNRE